MTFHLPMQTVIPTLTLFQEAYLRCRLRKMDFSQILPSNMGSSGSFPSDICTLLTTRSKIHSESQLVRSFFPLNAAKSIHEKILGVFRIHWELIKF